ncbi:hypothetical protein BH11PLA2_BH11PLA2_50450 [soil metagenome]
MTSKPCQPAMKNPLRVAAGKRNRALRKGLTPVGRAKLRAVALQSQPWLSATGPRTPGGKAIVSDNGRKRQKGIASVRQIRNEMVATRTLERDMRASRGLLVLADSV